MKGKKTDPEFLSNFISTCLSEGKITQEQIIDSANLKISEIDKKIKEVERLKILRSKLIDVVYAFGNVNKEKIDINFLNFSKIKKANIAKYICIIVKNGKLKLDNILCDDFSLEDTIYCINQLVELNIVIKDNDYISCGKLFEEYNKFIFCEV